MYVKEGLYDDFLEIVRHRRASRGYLPTPIPGEVIDCLLEAARWAPSGANSQPWEFLVVKDPAMTRKIGQLYVEFHDREYRHQDPGFPVDSKRWMLKVPVYIIPLVDRRLVQAYPQIEVETVGEEILQHSVAGAILLLWLAATTFGLSTTSATTFSFHRRRLRELFGIPDVYDIPCTLPIGYPARYQATRYRHPREVIVHRERYDPVRWLSDDALRARMELVRRSRYRGDGQLIPVFRGRSISATDDSVENRG